MPAGCGELAVVLLAILLCLCEIAQNASTHLQMPWGSIVHYEHNGGVVYMGCSHDHHDCILDLHQSGELGQPWIAC